MSERKIAILKADYIYDNYDNTRYLFEHISEWTIVSEEEYTLLKEYSYQKGFQVIETPVDQAAFIKETVTSLLAEAEAEKKAEEVRKAKEKVAREANRVKQANRAREEKLKKLQQLQKELGIEPTS
jgi:2-phospho-L-lactate transferase/gluconeogenesis factor (CofD/UPF0052 family)